MSDDVYERLRAFLHRLPGGFPTTESGVEMRILRKLFSPEEAGITTQLNSMMPEPISAIAPRLGLDERAAAEKVESMARRGLILRVRMGDEAMYAARQFVVGFYEAQLNTLDRELAELVEEYAPDVSSQWVSTKTKQMRVVPVGSAVDVTTAVASYDRVRELVQGKQFISVQPCICRKEQGLLGHHCHRPLETCVGFDMAAQISIENGLGRQISQGELMALLKLGEEHCLVPSPANAEDIMFLCMCCGCCCGVLRMLKRQPRPADHVQSSFYAAVNPELCSTCALCEERCQMDALKQRDGAFEVDLARCIGCGLCVAACTDGALSLVAKPEVLPVPANFFDTHMRIASERGLL